MIKEDTLKLWAKNFEKNLYMQDLIKEIYLLRGKINKAIEYIKEHNSGIITQNAGIIGVVPSNNILNILQGSEEK